MRIFNNKFFVLFLILTIGLFFFSTEVVHAGNVVTAVVSISNTVVNTVVGISEVALGSITGISFLSSDGDCRLDNVSRTPFAVYSGRCNSSNGNSAPTSSLPPAASTTATPPTVIIQANGSSGSISISSGSSAVISWTSTNADSCSISPTGWTGASGSQSTGNLTTNKTYTITCAGPAGSASNSVTINAVQPSPDFYPISSNDIKATLTKGAAGDSTTATITIVGLNGFSSTVTFSIYSISPPFPSGTTYEFSRTTIDSSHYASGATFKVHIGSGLDVSQQYSIIVQATGSGLTRTTTVLLNANVKNPTWIEF